MTFAYRSRTRLVSAAAVIAISSWSLSAALASAQPAPPGGVLEAITLEEYTRDLKAITGEIELDPEVVRASEGVRVVTDRFLGPNLVALRNHFANEFRKAGFEHMSVERFPLDFKASWKGGPGVRTTAPVGENLFVEIPGRNPDQLVIVGAHYDTTAVGRRGANDNGTGVAAILSLARAFKQSGVQPEQTLRFVLFDGEEWGYVGSSHHVENLVISGDRHVRMMVNLDMIGDNDTDSSHLMYDAGKSFNPVIEPYLRAVNDGYGLGFVMKESKWGPYQSDQTPFIELDWMGVSLFEHPHDTSGVMKTTDYYHEHNHATTDTTATVNLPYAVKLTKFTAAVVHDLVARGSLWKGLPPPTEKLAKAARKLRGRKPDISDVTLMGGSSRARTCRQLLGS